ncbi:unnamed protein product [Darwinula stevensoni]|uniref:Uncharacterized protein n=1 Tax=Darwinula stevensoni TaxID=69355 RepID=A0A7R8XCU9_9CRUS|nr:unnamed protein product [Darwinula stevensoni]CAG0889187.1 unnamed protein product [Darwinula stevensoni]
MPRLKQPKTLTKLALEGVGTFYEGVCHLALSTPREYVTEEGSEKESLKNRISALQELLFTCVPWFHHDELVNIIVDHSDVLIEKAKRRYQNAISATNFVFEVHIVLGHAMVILYPGLKHLIISRYPKLMRDAVIHRLNALQSLEVLDLGSGSGGWLTISLTTFVVNGLQHMPNLVSFTLNSDCSDDVLRSLGKHCPKLRHLDVYGSQHVTDQGLAWIIFCKELRSINLFRTSVEVPGLALLLKELKYLQTLYRCNELGQVLEYMTGKYCNLTPLNLREFRCRDASQVQMKLLAKLCPNVEYVSLFHDDRISDLGVLASLENLKVLHLLSADFYSDQVNLLLKRCGSRLSELHMEHVDEIDTFALMDIAQICPNLTSLKFFNCEFHNYGTFQFRTFEIAPFQNLQQLVCVCDCDVEQTVFLLQHCYDIEEIILGPHVGLNDECLSSTLQRNSMQKLTKFHMRHTNHLSLASVYALIDTCPNLQSLTQLEGWNKISNEELENLRAYIRSQNIDLDTNPGLHAIT